MRKVLFKRWIPPVYEGLPGNKKEGTGCWSDFVNPGLFHCWAQDYEEFDGSYPVFTFAIIEEPDGMIAQVLPKNFKFVD